jgi:hypothetical protein
MQTDSGTTEGIPDGIWNTVFSRCISFMIAFLNITMFGSTLYFMLEVLIYDRINASTLSRGAIIFFSWAVANYSNLIPFGLVTLILSSRRRLNWVAFLGAALGSVLNWILFFFNLLFYGINCNKPDTELLRSYASGVLVPYPMPGWEETIQWFENPCISVRHCATIFNGGGGDITCTPADTLEADSLMGDLGWSAMFTAHFVLQIILATFFTGAAIGILVILFLPKDRDRLASLRRVGGRLRGSFTNTQSL